MIVPLMIGTTELLLLGGLALLIFGGKKLPEMMRGLGQGVKEFKDGMSGNQPQNIPENNATQSQDEGTEQNSQGETKQ